MRRDRFFYLHLRLQIQIKTICRFKKTLVQQAVEEVPGFAQSYEKFRKRMLIDQKAAKTIAGYMRMLSHISLHYGRTPENLTQEEPDSFPADRVRVKISTFKHLIHGLRYYCKAPGIEKKLFYLPVLKKDRSLPEILNAEECRRLFRVSSRLRDRVILSLIYSAGLRSCELPALRVKDIDSGRMLIHIRRSKNRKDRYVPLSELILQGLRKYYRQERPQDFLFPGEREDAPLSPATPAQILRRAVSRAGIRKKITLHTLRHTYATHLPEMGVNILRVKELLGHTDIRTTMLYLQVMNLSAQKAFSPFDRLCRK
jgi:site-specific recombinase XerD